MIRFACRLDRPGFTLDATFEGGSGVTALFGPSGSGKSTIIRLLAGLDRPNAGAIEVNGETLVKTSTGRHVPAHKRRIGLVFQDALLFPHLSVAANLAYGGWFARGVERRITRDPVIEVLGIGHLLDRRPATLSGGERQRVAIGRALLMNPRLLLMDEPLAALDEARKLEILPFIERLRDQFGIPILYVSHAVEEVARLAATVIKLEAGRVIAAGGPAEVLGPTSLARSAERFAAISILTAPIKAFLPDYGVTILDHPAGDIVVPGRFDEGRDPVRVTISATQVTLGIGRPGHVSVRTALTGTVTKLEVNDGPFALVTIALTGGDVLRAYATRLATDGMGLDVGDEVQAMVKAVSIDERQVPGLRAIGPSSP
jgi:molybdate transport system ATP-binding protein